MQVVWFKRDLRVRDHRPLREAAARGPTLCLFVYEPVHLTSPEFETAHIVFANECLRELDEQLGRLGTRLTIRRGSVPEVFSQLDRELRPAGGIAGIWSHEETGLRWSYDRDLRVAEWCRERDVPFQEYPCNGVVRRLGTRDGWASRWQRRIARPPLKTPEGIAPVDLERFEHGRILQPRELDLPPSDRNGVQRGGIAIAHETLASFLSQRGVNYRADMSTPNEGWDGCSRLSPYLAWGSMSMREAYHATRKRVATLGQESGEDPRWRDSLKSFEGRLRWHCHFMQKLETEPDIEFHNMNRAFDGLREDEFDESKFAAWCDGTTGYPMVDACMRAVRTTGWLNFRMRAMLVSFSSYQLWLHWRRPARFLAQQFVDFEPGIHFSQFQMQSGVTGINTVRIYSPRKQQIDHDPDGIFVRRWVPELEGVPDKYLIEPHRMPVDVQEQSGCRIGSDYPKPIVDHAKAYRAAKERIWSKKGSSDARKAAGDVFERHGSRRRTFARSRRR